MLYLLIWAICTGKFDFILVVVSLYKDSKLTYLVWYPIFGI